MSCLTLFQRAKIQDKCKQFTTKNQGMIPWCLLFQRAKIQDKCKQFTTIKEVFDKNLLLFQRAKIQDKCKQFFVFSFAIIFITFAASEDERAFCVFPMTF